MQKFRALGYDFFDLFDYFSKNLTSVAKTEDYSSAFENMILYSGGQDEKFNVFSFPMILKELDKFEGVFLLVGGDAVFDIRVKGATYATYIPEGQKQEFPLVKEGKDFVLPQVTVDIPLFNSVFGARHCIKTDGKEIEYQSFLLSTPYTKVFNDYSNPFSVSWLRYYKKTVFLRHSCRTNENIPKPYGIVLDDSEILG